ncbi:MAG: hypothetical protein U9N41_00520 [Euryarchaeota archaeon]|nr:hypothetical protein [Euryarchaeota archaeon]
MKGSELELALKDLVAMEGVNASAVVTRDGIMVNFLNRHTPEAVSPLSSLVAMDGDNSGEMHEDA